MVGRGQGFEVPPATLPRENACQRDKPIIKRYINLSSRVRAPGYGIICYYATSRCPCPCEQINRRDLCPGAPLFPVLCVESAPEEGILYGKQVDLTHVYYHQIISMGMKLNCVEHSRIMQMVWGSTPHFPIAYICISFSCRFSPGSSTTRS